VSRTYVVLAVAGVLIGVVAGGMAVRTIATNGDTAATRPGEVARRPVDGGVTTVAGELSPTNDAAETVDQAGPMPRTSSSWDGLRGSIPTNDAEAALALANEWRSAEPKVQSWVSPESLSFLFPDGVQVDVLLPEDRMVISVAPYLSMTHPCSQHSVSGCRGEFVSREFSYTIRDQDGRVLDDGVAETGDNGFLDLWVPRDEILELEIEAPVGRASRMVSTFSDAETCVTDMELRI